MIDKKSNKKIRELTDVVLDLKNRDEARRFFRDLLTEAELVEFGNRWKAARMLAKKELYLKIQNETGLSSKTIARVSRWLNNGTGGYKLMLKRIKSNYEK